jgi:hypothetical protein
MDERQQTQFMQSLGPVRKRIRLLLVLRHAFMLGTAGAAAALVLMVLSRWKFELGEPPILALAVLIGLGAGAVWGGLRKLTPFAVARAAERRLDLKERLSSAVALSESGDDMVRALVEDAERSVSSVNPKEVFPAKRTREMTAFLGAILVLLGVFFMPQITGFQSKTRQQEVKVMKQEGRRLRALAKESLKKVDPKNQEIVKRVALNMDKLGKKLESGRMNRKQAMLAVKHMSKDIEKAQDRLAQKNAGKKSYEQAARDMQELSKELAKEMLDKLQRDKAAGKDSPELRALEKRLKDMQAGKQMSGEQLDALQKEFSKYAQSQSGVQIPPELASVMGELLKNKDYQKAMEMMAALSKKLGSGQMSKMDQKALEKQLKAMAKALEGTDLDQLAKQMKKAAEQLAKMDPKKAAQMLAQMKGMSPQDMAKLGKMGAG